MLNHQPLKFNFESAPLDTFFTSSPLDRRRYDPWMSKESQLIQELIVYHRQHQMMPPQFPTSFTVYNDYDGTPDRVVLTKYEFYHLFKEIKKLQDEVDLKSDQLHKVQSEKIKIEKEKDTEISNHIKGLSIKHEKEVTELNKKLKAKAELVCIHPEGVIVEHEYWKFMKSKNKFQWLFYIYGIASLVGYMICLCL